MNYYCCTDTRRAAISLHPTINGIDYIEVLDQASDPYNERQTTLFLHFIKPIVADSLSISNFFIKGGERIQNIQVVSIEPESEISFPASTPDERAKTLVVKVSEAGDFSTYSLLLLKDRYTNEPPDGYDKVLSSVDFSFKVLCANDFDCQPICNCPPENVVAPQINYLAKDYASFKRLMLDRMALLAPDWQERNAADMGIMLVELFAYVGDHLSYRQDAITTEAYLHTARKRVSVRRHARLVDYFMHDGCNARAWLHIQAGPGADGLLLAKGEGADRTRIITRTEGLSPAILHDSKQYEQALQNGVKVFELMHDIKLYTVHNQMAFYTWGNKECCLLKGATGATLLGNFPDLKVGDVLIFCEVLGAQTGAPQDADPNKKHAVRLTEVTTTDDKLYLSPTNNDPLQVTEIKWSKADALPFPLCISNHQGIINISLAYGNNVLIDHGLTINDGDTSSLFPAVVPVSTQSYAMQDAGCHCGSAPTNSAIPARFRPWLLNGPLTFVAPYNANKTLPASQYMTWSLRSALPAIQLREIDKDDHLLDQKWNAKRDLLSSDSIKKEFVVEIESDGTSSLRFGNNANGASPADGNKLLADYRLGNGTAGNVGAGSLGHIVTNNAAIIANMANNAAVWNPMSAQGGAAAETAEEVKQYAPEAFKIQQRAVTAADYEAFAVKTNPEVQRAAATFRWTGSWKTVFLSIDKFNSTDVDAAFKKDLRAGLEKYRMAGFDLEIDTPLYVSLEIEMVICVNQRFFASDVKKALLELFSNGTRADGALGVFHPDNFSFGQPVYLSRLYAAAQSVQGVDSVRITKFQRQGKNSAMGLTDGKLLLGRREIARLDNDRNFPEHGLFNLIMKGGQS